MQSTFNQAQGQSGGPTPQQQQQMAAAAAAAAQQQSPQLTSGQGHLAAGQGQLPPQSPQQQQQLSSGQVAASPQTGAAGHTGAPPSSQQRYEYQMVSHPSMTTTGSAITDVLDIRIYLISYRTIYSIIYIYF